MSSSGSQGSDSKIAHAYDEAIAKAQSDAEELERAREQHSGAEMSEPPIETIVGDLTANGPDSLSDEEDGIRGREFPTPPDVGYQGDGKRVVDQNTLPEDESRNGNLPGQVAGDIQPGSAVPSIFDQGAVTPDLASEQR